MNYILANLTKKFKAKHAQTQILQSSRNIQAVCKQFFSYEFCISYSGRMKISVFRTSLKLYYSKGINLQKPNKPYFLHSLKFKPSFLTARFFNWSFELNINILDVNLLLKKASWKICLSGFFESAIIFSMSASYSVKKQ